jgi:hypothetical protein
MAQRPKIERKPKQTDAERHKALSRHGVEASDDPKDFDRAFDKIVPTKPSPKDDGG